MRISDWSSDVCSSDLRRLGVELLVVDEIQHLRREGNDVNDVTDALKRWLDAGSVPLVLVGNMDSQPFFERNKQLCARLGTPLDLSPLAASKQRDAIHFKAFCSRYDDKLVESGAVRKSPGLSGSAMLERSEEHTSELQSLMRISYAVLCLKKK